MRKTWMAAVLALTLIFLFASRSRAQSNLVVAFSTSNTTPLNPGFAGFTTEILDSGLEYNNTNFQQIAATTSPGWLLYPGGTSADAFDWSTGLTVTNWVNEFSNSVHQPLMQETYEPLLGKGGAQFTNFACMAQNMGGAKLIVCINGFTDSNTSAGAFAAFALSNHIPVALWELCNEPYTFLGPGNFFTNGTDYANKMKPYYDAIKAADSNAVVGIFYSDPANQIKSWDNDLANYTPQYWDAVIYHHYPPLPTNGVPFSELMALDNGELLTNTTEFVTNYLAPKNTNAAVKYLVTEYAPCNGNGQGTPNPPSTTLFGGIYAAEYTMRLSTLPQMSYVGTYQLFNLNGIYATNVYSAAVSRAAQYGYVTNTGNLSFGFYLGAQVSGEAVAYWALTRSSGLYSTIVGTNGPTVPVGITGQTMPAVYAQAYQGSNGKRFVLLTNKGATNATVQLMQDNEFLTNQLLETYVTGSDPGAINSGPPPYTVAIQSQTTTNPVVIPEYSVVRLEWTVFTVPPPALNVRATAGGYVLSWTGLTNVTYNVLAATSIAGSWSTLGEVSSAQTNFTFTDPNMEMARYYRLAVP